MAKKSAPVKTKQAAAPHKSAAGVVTEALHAGEGTDTRERGRALLCLGVISYYLLLPPEEARSYRPVDARKVSLAMRLAHRPGALLASLEPFAKNKVNLLKIESRPIHGRPWEYQFFVDVEAENKEQLEQALAEVRAATSELRVLGSYQAARRS